MKIIGRLYLALAGWTIIDKEMPKIDRAILIFAPHTSNWDFMTMIMAKFVWGFKVRFLGKHSLFKWPFGWFFRALGGMPVVRHEKHNVVTQVVELIAANEHIYLALAPEGTRSYTAFWKTGFYHIAERAKLPIVMFYLDCKTRTIGFGEVFHVTGDVEADMKKFADFYADKEGYNPEQKSIIQSKENYEKSNNDQTNLN